MVEDDIWSKTVYEQHFLFELLWIEKLHHRRPASSTKTNFPVIKPCKIVDEKNRENHSLI